MAPVHRIVVLPVPGDGLPVDLGIFADPVCSVLTLKLNVAIKPILPIQLAMGPETSRVRCRQPEKTSHMEYALVSLGGGVDVRPSFLPLISTTLLLPVAQEVT